MSRYTGPRNRISRKFGINLWGRAKNPLEKKKSSPGKAPGRKVMKKSDYGIQLDEKQKLRYYYGCISEKQFRNTFKKALQLKGDTGEEFLGLLESRLDVAVYRMNFVPTIFAARQFVNHGHFMVNGKKVNIPSFRLKPGDVISVREKSRKNSIIQSHIESPERDIPG
ncbi:MAG: 30S ribosomal protein S4, partial [Spirochaetes bacterium GWF1_41_5]